MSSGLRHQTLFDPITVHNTAASFPHSVSPPPSKKQRMTLTQTYRLAHRARGKLSSEASRGDHDLRLLVGHANLLDGLMLELQDAEREQEAWFEQTVSVASKTPSDEPMRVQWSDQQHQLDVPDASDEEDSEDSDSDDEDIYADVKEAQTLTLAVPSRRPRARSPPPVKSAIYDDDDEMAVDSDDENEELALVRTESRKSDEHDMALPELVHDSDDSDDDMSPESPPATHTLSSHNVIAKDFAITVSQKETTVALEMDQYYLPQRQSSLLVAAY